MLKRIGKWALGFWAVVGTLPVIALFPAILFGAVPGLGDHECGSRECQAGEHLMFLAFIAAVIGGTIALISDIALKKWYGVSVWGESTTGGTGSGGSTVS